MAVLSKDEPAYLPEAVLLKGLRNQKAGRVTLGTQHNKPVRTARAPDLKKPYCSFLSLMPTNLPCCWNTALLPQLCPTNHTATGRKHMATFLQK